MTSMREFFAPTAKGMEELLLNELNSLGAEDAKVGRAGVRFRGELEVAYRACLWSRIANRVLMPLKVFPAPTPEKLYGGVKSIRWSDHLSPNHTIAVDFTSTSSKITHTHFGALKVKDAIVDQFRSVQGVRPSVNVHEPDIRINVYVLKDEATVSLDLSGESLHRRGYRDEGVPAPLKENLAAALLYLADWPKLAFSDSKDFSFLDPMCGSGTLPIEAAMIAGDVAPGIQRNYFGFLKWKSHDEKLWKRLLGEAKIRAEKGLGRKDFPRITGYDADFRSVRVAIKNLEQAGLRGKIHIEKRQFSDCQPATSSGLLIVNPPYGERLGATEELQGLYKLLGDQFKQRFKGWKAFVFTGSSDLAKCIGLKTSKRTPLFNGALECRLLRFDLY